MVKANDAEEFDGKRVFQEVLDEAKKNKRWHHDIRFIGTEYVEHVVKKFQITKNEKFLNQVIENYAIFRNGWAKQFAKYLDCDLEAGKVMHDEVIWKSCMKFDRTQARKGDGYAFNAYLVSALLNGLKNHRNSQQAAKNHPRVQCPICAEQVFQIDHKHLKHVIDLDRYVRMFPNFPLVSTHGKTLDPITGEEVDEIRGYGHERYSVDDFKREFEHLFSGAKACPVTKFPLREGIELEGGEIAEWYAPTLMAGYTKDEFYSDYPDVKASPPPPAMAVSWTEPITCKQFRENPDMVKALFDRRNAGVSWNKLEAEFNLKRAKGMTATHVYESYVVPFKCPFTGQQMDKMTQRHLDEFFAKNPARRGPIDETPYLTTKARQVDVLNPYTNEVVKEMTMADLRDAKVTWREHVETNAQTWVDKHYPFLVACPFTGRRTKGIKKSDLVELNKSVMEFYEAVCKHPMRKWQVRCALCGDWVQNIWEHLEKKEHYYATSMTPEDFEAQYSTGGRKVVVTSNSYVQNDSGDVVHLADLFGKKHVKHFDPLEIEDSLLDVAEDEVDEQIARSFRQASTLEDIFYTSAKQSTIKLPQAVKAGAAKAIRALIKEKLGSGDFDIVGPQGKREVNISVPSRDTLKKKLAKLIEASDL